MVAHVVLFRPKADLSRDQQRAFIAALEHALSTIPQITRARVGRRVTLGRDYDAQNAQSFPFAAIIEFEDVEGLRGYLEHPAHEMLGAQFYVTSEAAMVFDFELLPGDALERLMA
jgi:hypothetical protein